MHKWVKLLYLLIILTILSACSYPSEQEKGNAPLLQLKDESDLDPRFEEKQLTIGMSLSSLTNERWVNEKGYFEAEVSKYGAKVVIQDANWSESTQEAQIESLISQKIDVLVINAINDVTAASSVALAKKAGIPVLGYSRMIQNADLDAFIGFDAEQIGETLAKSAIERVPKGKYMIINGSPFDNNARLQQVGYHKVLAPYIESGLIQIVFEDWCENWSPEKAFSKAESGLLLAKNNVDAILVSNDGMAGGVIKALEKQKLDGKVLVTGTDGELPALQRIAEGTQTFTLLYPQREFAEEAARAAISLAKKLMPADATGKTSNGSKDIPTIMAKSVLVTKDNLEDTIIIRGLHRWEDVYKNDAEKSAK